jgi:LysM repeat protein
VPAPAISFYKGFSSPTSVTHIVGPFETLWRISKTYGVDMNDIMQANHIANPGQLKEGQKLTIPGTMGARRIYSAFPRRAGPISWFIIRLPMTGMPVRFRRSTLRAVLNGLGYHS